MLDNEDFVFVHIEAPDECGHDGDIELKIRSIERIDHEIVGPIADEMNRRGGALPHADPAGPRHAHRGAHAHRRSGAVPRYDSRSEKSRPAAFDEKSCAGSGRMLEDGFLLMGLSSPGS